MKYTLIFILTLFTLPLAHAAKIPSSIKSDYRSSSRAARSLGQLAEALEANGDRRAQFAHIYSITIAATSNQLAQGAFENPRWVESLIVNYANIYRRTIQKELSGQRREVPLAWQYTFSYADRKDWVATFDVIYGIKVHITRDLVEALYITPTDFNEASIRRDFFRISSVLKSSMPRIWRVYARYSGAMGNGKGFSALTVADWIARLRQRAWEDARTTAHLSARRKAAVLTKLDRESKRVREFGVLAVLH